MSESKVKKNGSEFDYIIVGGGSAGCTVAGRLSEDVQCDVLVTEAGGTDNSPLIRWPAGYSRLSGERIRWEWQTVPQRHLDDRRLLFPQGKIIGGGSSVNSMVYIRGNARDYDHWRALGNSGWGYSDVLPYFKRSEDNERLRNAYHGVGGPLGVADQRGPINLTRIFIRAAQEAGVPYNDDFNGVSQYGVGLYQVTQRHGIRSSATVFLGKKGTRKNLSVLTRTRVTKILIEKGKAVGVELIRGDGARPETMRARREVIIASGAIGSPKLLMLSGIGAADDLRRLGITPLADLPGVGKNLQDHLDIYCCVRLNAPVSYNGQDRGLWALRHGLQYLLYGTGAITSNVCEGGAFVSTSGNAEWPDIQMHFLPAYVIDHGRVRVKGHGMTLNTAVLRPKSRGEIRLQSADPLLDPLIDPNYLAEPQDLKDGIEGFKIAREILAAPSFGKIFDGEHLPGAHVRTDAQIEDYVRQWSKTDFHPAGTCKMGSDKSSVVDTELKVHGISGLRVVDNSIMPTLVSGNTNAAALMIGERGADAILGRRLPVANSGIPANGADLDRTGSTEIRRVIKSAQSAANGVLA